MSYASRQENTSGNLKGLGLTVAVHIAVIAGVMALPAITVVMKKPGEVTGVNIPLKPEPVQPPETRPDDPLIKPAPNNPVIDRLKPQVTPPSLPKQPDYGFSDSGGGSIFDGTGAGNGMDIPFDPVPPVEAIPDPVIVEAKLNTRYAADFQPAYPPGQLRLDKEGTVSVRVLVGTNGRVKDLQLISAPHESFWTATQRHALKKWRFKPATKDGKPFESWITLKVQFTIDS